MTGNAKDTAAQRKRIGPALTLAEVTDLVEAMPDVHRYRTYYHSLPDTPPDGHTAPSHDADTILGEVPTFHRVERTAPSTPLSQQELITPDRLAAALAANISRTGKRKGLLLRTPPSPDKHLDGYAFRVHYDSVVYPYRSITPILRLTLYLPISEVERWSTTTDVLAAIAATRPT